MLSRRRFIQASAAVGVSAGAIATANAKEAKPVVYVMMVLGEHGQRAQAPAEIVPSDEDGMAGVRATFGHDYANFRWVSWIVYQIPPGGGDGEMVTAKFDDFGTKVADQTWIITSTIKKQKLELIRQMA